MAPDPHRHPAADPFHRRRQHLERPAAHLYPHGYGDPDAEPRYPQTFAEIMAGRIAISDNEAGMPDGLGDVLVGPATAREIRWLSE